MKKFLSIFMSTVAVLSLMSCDSDKEVKNTITYTRNFAIATVNPTRTRTVYTIPSAARFVFDPFSTEKAEFTISEILMPDNSVMKMTEVSDMKYGISSLGVDYVFTDWKNTTYNHFTADTPVSVKTTLSGIVWTNLGTSNTSAEIEFASGSRLTAFGSDLGFFTNATITDTQNPDTEAFTTFEPTANNVYVLLSKYPTANIYVYQACLSKDTQKKIDFVIEDVQFAIDAENGTMSLIKDEAIPYSMKNGVKDEALKDYKITDLHCTVNADFTIPGSISFNCGDRYEFSAQLLETLPKDNI